MVRTLSTQLSGRRPVAGLLLISLLALSACSSSDDDDGAASANDPATMPDDGVGMETVGDDPGAGMPDPTNTPDDGMQLPETTGQLLAFVAGATPGFDAGQIERLSISDGDIATGTYPATLSDIRVDTDGRNLYQIGRFNLDSITRFDPIDTSVTDFQFSVNGDDLAANPYDIAFVNENKAYVVRYGSDKVWIINPNATNESEFMLGELDLSAYDADEPNASAAIIVDGKLFVLMERLTVFDPDKAGYIAVFDTNTDTEIDTGQGNDGLMGIALTSVNPGGLQYVESTDEIYVLGRGNLFNEFNEVPGDPYQGGIETVNPDTFEAELLLDDGDEQNNQGFFIDSLVVSGSRGYLLTYQGFQTTTLRSFNPTTGLLDPAPVAELVELDVSTLGLGPNGRLWVGVRGETPGFVLIDPNNNQVINPLVPTQLNPINIVFMNVPQ